MWFSCFCIFTNKRKGFKNHALHTKQHGWLAAQVVEMVKNRLSQPDAQESGWLLDGYPRSAEQADAIQEAGIRPDVFILIEVSPPLMSS